MRSFPIVCSVLLVCGVFTTNGESVSTTPNVVIDGYTVNSTLNSPATLPLGTTVILVCRISGIPHGLQTNYHWTYPNEPCQQTGYAGRKINNNIIAINITSTSDGGTYTCNVTAEGMDASQQFQLNVNGGQVVHSYGRLILNERVITDKQQLQPPNNDSGDGRIECRVSSGGARFSYHGRYVLTDTSGDVHEIRNGSTTTLVMRDKVFNNFVNFEGNCAGIFHYLFLSNDTLPDVSITGTTSTNTSITVNIGTIPSGIERVIIGYHRLDLGLPVVGEYVNNGKRESRTFSSLVPGAKYRITAWGLGGDDDRRMSKSPAVREVTTMEQTPSPPRHLTRTRVFDDGIELNWIPPREPNGDIQHYIIKYTTQNGTQQEINTTNNTNYYNLTGLERGQTYNTRVVAVNSAEAVNSAGGGGGMSRPGGFQPLSYLSLNQQQFVMYNVPEVQGKEQNTYVAMAVVAGVIPEEDVYTNGVLGQGQMQGTIDEKGRSAITITSWYQKTLVFIEQGSGSDLQYQTYTPMIENNLGMISDKESNVVFKNLVSGSNYGITSIFLQDEDTYLWKTTDNTFLSLDTDTGNMKFTQAISSGSQFRFTEPPIVWESEAGVPKEFRPFAKLLEDRRELIKRSIDFPTEGLSIQSTYAARINVRNNKDGDQRLYVELQLEKANLKATTPNRNVDFEEVSWYQYYFVFAKTDEVSFEVFTPVAKHNLGLAIVGKTQSFSPSPPYGWTVFQFIAVGNNYWYWKVKGENLYMYCDPVTGDITATDDLSKRSQFSFLYDEEEEDQSDGKPPEQEVCKQETGEQEAVEQEAGRQRKMCKVQ